MRGWSWGPKSWSEKTGEWSSQTGGGALIRFPWLHDILRGSKPSSIFSVYSVHSVVQSPFFVPSRASWLIKRDRPDGMYLPDGLYWICMFEGSYP